MQSFLWINLQIFFQNLSVAWMEKQRLALWHGPCVHRDSLCTQRQPVYTETSLGTDLWP